jgi:hypothetical protein
VFDKIPSEVIRPIFKNFHEKLRRHKNLGKHNIGGILLLTISLLLKEDI